MCGIFGYTGTEEAAPYLIKGLSRLEYRGYDSAGIAVLNGEVSTLKSEGNISNLISKKETTPIHGQCGIAHTRWATHGEPNETNSHPHMSQSGRFSLVHNGIIENYLDLKSLLKENGYEFQSETDTEVFGNYIDYLVKTTGAEVVDLVPRLLQEVRGSFAIALLDVTLPQQILVARKGSPLIIGLTPTDTFLSSDPLALSEYCKEAVYLENLHYAVIMPGVDPQVFDNKGNEVSVEKSIIDQVADRFTVDKGEYEHFTLKEIHEQPDIARIHVGESFSTGHTVPELAEVRGLLKMSQRIVIIGCGTSLHASWLGKNYIERLAGVPVIVEQASEFRYGDPLLFETDLVIAVSQSGETADTLEGVRLVKDKGIHVIGMCNVKNSSLQREVDACMMLQAGPEIGVASTKAFMSQVLMFFRFSLHLAQLKGHQVPQEFVDAFKLLPNQLEETLKTVSKAQSIAEKYANYANMLYLGRGIQFPIAMEGALKLKELSYIHAEGYSSAEMKHGPLALIDENFPSVIVATDSEQENKNISTAKEIKSRKGDIVAIVQKKSEGISREVDDVIEIPDCNDMLAPFLATVPLQFLSYHMALVKGKNVDQPRNLAKSVTVE